MKTACSDCPQARCSDCPRFVVGWDHAPTPDEVVRMPVIASVERLNYEVAEDKRPDDNLTRDDLLILLIEECGEVIQAATKALRFGWETHYPNYGRNDYAVSREVGDLKGVIEALPLHEGIVENARKHKIEKARALKAKMVRRLRKS